MRRNAILLLLGSMLLSGAANGDGHGRRRHHVDPRDALLAALGSLTLECLGTVGPSSYETSSGVLARTFDGCRSRDGQALDDIDALLLLQTSVRGREQRLAAHFVARWNRFVSRFPFRRDEPCPTWTLANVIDAPTMESVARSMSPLRVGKEGYRYEVSSPRCQGNGECAVQHAAACAAGFGPQFVVGGDARRSLVEVDPVWWLTHYTFQAPGSNPFMLPGYYHAMSYYGDLPGSLYGAIERAGEACSEYIDGKHYIRSQARSDRLRRRLVLHDVLHARGRTSVTPSRS